MQNTAAAHYSVMKTTFDVEPGWKTYFKFIVLVFPAAAAMWFACLYLLPKLEAIWYRVGYRDATADGIIVVYFGWIDHIYKIAIALAVLLILLEWWSDAWRRYRRLVAGVVVFLVNTSVLFFMTSMLMYALLAAMPLLHK
jgi:hypothetical protein